MKQHIQELLRAALDTVLDDAPAPDSIQVEPTRDPQHGDLASNLALVMAKPLRTAPRALAQRLLQALPGSPWVARVEIAGPGFLNFFLAPGARQQVIPQILDAGAGYGHDRSGRLGRILVEFVSANPTGPLHVGHGRNAAYGDALANVLAASGWEVTREFYINDAGRQVDILTVSAWLRCLELQGETLPFPQRGYPAEYVRETADHLVPVMGEALRRPAAQVAEGLPDDPDTPDDADEAQAAEIKARQEAYLDALIARARTLLGEDYVRLQRAALDDMLGRIRATLELFGVRFDRWASERELVRSGAAANALEKLRAGGHVYEKDDALWLATAQLGDEKDRVLIKADGAATYFANDLAYHEDKLERGFPMLLDVWGADHHGYIARVRAAIAALTGHGDALNVQLVQFVTLSSGRMGKRSGNFVTLDELLREAGKDATRFFYLMRSQDQHLEFDVELARSRTVDNPVYYVQYAHARICSVLRQAGERGLAFDPAAAALARLEEPHEKALIALLTRYPETVAAGAQQFAPHVLTHYLREVADALHSYYNAHAFLVDEAGLRNARLALVAATRQILASGLGLLGVTAPERM